VTRILVTGAAGFIGSWVVKRLVELGCDVHACDLAADDAKLRRIAGAAVAEAVSWTALDVTDTDVVERAMQAVPVRNREGQAIGTWKYDGSTANGALAILAKHTGGFVERVELHETHEINITEVIVKLPELV